MYRDREAKASLSFKELFIRIRFGEQRSFGTLLTLKNRETMRKKIRLKIQRINLLLLAVSQISLIIAQSDFTITQYGVDDGLSDTFG